MVVKDKQRFAGSLLCGILISVSFLAANTVHDFPWINAAYTVINGYGIQHAIIALAFSYVLYRLKDIYKDDVISRKTTRVIAITSGLFGILNVCGCNMAYLGSLMVFHGKFWSVVFVLCVAGYSIAFYVLATWAVSLLARWDEAKPESSLGQIRARSYLTYCALIFACWLPWLVAYYPATADYDSMRQISTYLGIIPLSNHDPLFSSFVIGFIFNLGRFVGGDNFGLFLYVLLRGIIMALIYGYCVLFLRKSGVNRGIYLAVLVFYALTPVWGAYAKQPFKDTFTAALFCWFVVRTIVLVGDIQRDGQHVSSYVLYALSGLLVSLFRHNYLFVYVFSVIVIFIVLLRHKCAAFSYLISISGLVVYAAFNLFISVVLGAESGRPAEALAIPLQQTARAVRDYGDEMSAEDKEGIRRLLDFDALAEVYDPVISDPVKNTIGEEATTEDYLAYLSVWLKQLPSYFSSYVEAGFTGSYGYYAFTNDGYPSGGKGNCGMVVLEGINNSNPVFNEAYDFSYEDTLRIPRKVLALYQQWWHHIPVLSLTDTIPFYTWAIIVAWIFIGARKGRIWGLIPAMLLLAILTCIASPVNGSFRYFVPIVAATPTLLAIVVGRHASA